MRRVRAVESRSLRAAKNDGGLRVEGYDEEAAEERLRKRVDDLDAIPTPSTNPDEIARQQRLEAARFECERIERAAEAFSKPFWSIRSVLGWIAFRDPDAINLNYLDEMPLRSGERKDNNIDSAEPKVEPNWGIVRQPNPGNVLFAFLLAGKLTAIARGGTKLGQEYWAHETDNWQRNNHETWPPLRFSRCCVLKAFPAMTKKVSPPLVEFAAFLSKYHAAAIAERRPANREALKSAAEKYFGGAILWKKYDEAVEEASIVNKAGRRKNPEKEI